METSSKKISRMKNIYTYVFFCIYIVVLKKSYYGQRNAAVVFISLVFCALATSAYFLSVVVVPQWRSMAIMMPVIGVTVVISFVFNSRYFENRRRFKEILSKYGAGTVSHRIIGAVILLATFCIYILTILYADRYIAAEHQRAIPTL